MAKFTIVTLGAALLFGGRTLAQAPLPKPPLPPPSETPALPPPTPATATESPTPSAPDPLGPGIVSHQQLSPLSVERLSPEPAGRFWATSDYLYAWMFGTNLPPLVTTS